MTLMEILSHLEEAEGPIFAVVDEEGRITRASRSFRRLTADDAVGRSLEEFIDSASRRGRSLDSATNKLVLREEQGALQTLDCSVHEVDEGLLIVGAKTFLVHSDLLEAKSQLENRLTLLNRELQRKVHELEKAQEEIRTLTGLLPICAYCKKIRNDNGYWESLELYITERVDVNFSHGICEDCLNKHFPDDADD